MKTTRLNILILSLIFFISCSEDNDNNCIDYQEPAQVTTVDAPETTTVDETVEVQVTFEVKNACGEFQDFQEEISGTTRTIEVMAQYNGCACAQIITTRSATYTFSPETTGEHLLRFRSGTNEFVEVNILVEASTPSEGE